MLETSRPSSPTVWVCLTTVCGAHDAAQSAADASHDDMGGRVGQAFLMMSVGDRGAGTIEGPETDPGLGSLGEVGGQRLGGGRQGGDATSAAPGFPQPPGGGVEVRVESASSASMAAAIRSASPAVSPPGPKVDGRAVE